MYAICLLDGDSFTEYIYYVHVISILCIGICYTVCMEHEVWRSVSVYNLDTLEWTPYNGYMGKEYNCYGQVACDKL